MAAMRDNNAVNRTIGGDRDIIDDRVNGIAQVFEARDERDIELTRGELPAKRRRMIELNLARPTVNQRSRVKVFDAAESSRTRHLQAQTSPLGEAVVRCPFGPVT